MTHTSTNDPKQLYFEQIAQEAAQSAILHVFSGFFTCYHDLIWQMKNDKHPDDAALLDFISNAFGIWGGGSLNPEGWYEHKGGKHPYLLIQNRQHQTTHKLEGQQLVKAFRQLYRIHGDQLSLF